MSEQGDVAGPGSTRNTTPAPSEPASQQGGHAQSDSPEHSKIGEGSESGTGRVSRSSKLSGPLSVLGEGEQSSLVNGELVPIESDEIANIEENGELVAAEEEPPKEPTPEPVDLVCIIH
uniref:Uncharacterized protein LOC102804691 n=1 Tax=Saccoglossus kowalevskii TaxID=10224 RepID=A0ABM0M1I3_SACKO|nr:PREDICTED: uncharacterized protein LOC102804691 [Saccoglossus kowalevskii]